MRDIFIYGEVVPSFIAGYDGYVNLKDVVDQLAEANGEDIRVRINCIGGDVNEGFAIYNELRRYADKHKAQVTTLAEGMCASIATVIFLAGDKRIVNEYTEPFVHNAWTYAIGDANQILKTATDLEKCNDTIANHYASHTDLSYEQARSLMNEDTYISAEDCVTYRFAHEIESVIKPLNSILKSNKMSQPNKKKGLFAKLMAMAGISNKIVFDAENREVDFYELADSDAVEVGAKATVDGKPAAEASASGDGKIVMASGETYVFNGEVLEEIIPAGDESTEEETMTEEEMQALANALQASAKTIKDLRAQLATATAKVEGYEKLKSDFEALKAGRNADDDKGGASNKNKFASAIEKRTTKK